MQIVYAVIVWTLVVLNIVSTVIVVGGIGKERGALRSEEAAAAVVAYGVILAGILFLGLHTDGAVSKSIVAALATWYGANLAEAVLTVGKKRGPRTPASAAWYLLTSLVEITALVGVLLHH